MTYEVRVDIQASKFLNSCGSKTRRIIKDNLKALKETPYPSPEAKKGDREQVSINGEKVYRMHISRSYTAFYVVNEEQKQAVITDIVDIDTAHKMYD